MSNPDGCIFVGVLGYVYALEKSTGAILWSSTLSGTGFNPTIINPHPPTSSLLVSSGPNLRCLSAQTGGQKWENPLMGIGFGYSMVALEPSRNHSVGPSNAGSSSSSVAQLFDYVFVGCNRVVRAIRLSDGADLWEFTTPLTASFSAVPALLVEDGILFVSGNRHVWALDAFRGHELWKVRLPAGDGYHTLATMHSSALSRPSRFDPSSSATYETTKSPLQNLLFVGANGYLTRIEAEQGFPALVDTNSARLNLKGTGYHEVQSVPLPSSNSAIVASGVNLRRIGLGDGSLMWENPLKGMGLGLVSVLVGGGVAPARRVSHSEDSLPSYDTAVGASLGQSSSSSDAKSSWNDRVFVSVDGKIHAVCITDGTTLWKYKPSFFTRIHRPAHLLADANSKIYLAGSGVVHCIDADVGSQLWISKEPASGFATLSCYATGNGETNRSNAFLPVIKRTQEDDDRRRNHG
ncbi:quinon protein alcohol dehydrogenase-like superfamily [Cladochytrium replicatum]|nr:quinon protein alcohol dehydrogenase-like superfamily [Cladochytrium replicatum]